MKIMGLQKLTLLDYPGRTACTVFTGGCNLRCPFCHNAPLVLPGRGETSVSQEELFAFLRARKKLLDGVCVTGGEPTLHEDLPEFLGELHALGYAVKLDTNGTRPDMVERVIEEGLVDYVAMDIKSSFERYAEACGVETDLEAVERSIGLLMRGRVPYEFRTTVVDELHTPEVIAAAAGRIRGARAYFLQVFKDSGDLIAGEGFHAPTPEKMEELARAARAFVPNTAIRGL